MLTCSQTGLGEIRHWSFNRDPEEAAAILALSAVAVFNCYSPSGELFLCWLLTVTWRHMIVDSIRLPELCHLRIPLVKCHV